MKHCQRISDSQDAVSLNGHTPGQGQYRDVERYQQTLVAYLAKAAIKVKRVSKGPSIHPEPVEGLRRCSWFDKLTTNGSPTTH